MYINENICKSNIHAHTHARMHAHCLSAFCSHSWSTAALLTCWITTYVCKKSIIHFCMMIRKDESIFSYVTKLPMMSFSSFVKVPLCSQAIQDGSVKCNFKGFAMGDSWISPVDSVLTWGPYLYATVSTPTSGDHLTKITY